MTFSTHDSVIIPHEKNRGVVHCPSPPRNEAPCTHTHVRTYKYPDTQRIVEAVGILMIITAIITIMIQDASLLQIICYH